MLPWLHRNTVTADERDGLVEYAGRGRRKPKPPPTEIDSVGSAIEYFDITVLIGCTRSAAASVYLADHDLISSTRRRRRTWRWSWRRCRRRRRGWKWSVAQADGVKLNLPGASEIFGNDFEKVNSYSLAGVSREIAAMR